MVTRANQTKPQSTTRGAADFFSLIVKELKPTKEAPLDGARLVQMLCSLFPAFNDVTTYKGRQVFVLKKVQLLLADLARHVAPMDPAWSFDTKQLTVFADNVLPCVLRELGILKITDADLAQRIDSSKVIAVGDAECELRLCAVAACERIVAKLKGAVTCHELDFYLWRLGKSPKYRNLPRHYCQNTVFY